MYHALLQAAEREHRHMALVVPGEADQVEMRGEYTRIYHVEAPRCPWFDSQYRLLLPHRFLLPFPTSIRRILEEEQPDLIEICDKYALAWLAGAVRKHWIPGVGRPRLVGLNCERMDDNLAIYLGPEWRNAASLFIKRAYRRLFDQHIAVSPYVAGELLEPDDDARRYAIPFPHVTVLPMGVEAGDFGPQHRKPEVRRRLLNLVGGDARTRLLLYAGRLSPEKNIPLLVEMMMALDGVSQAHPAEDFRLLVAGRGPLEMWLAEQATLLRGRIVMLGHLSDRGKLAELLANTDAFIHPNPREPFGIAPLEAMCSELPLVAPSQGGVMAYCGPRNAWLAEPNGPSFAAAVRAVFQDDARRAVRVAEGRRTALAHDWSRIAEQFFHTYEDFCRQPTRPDPVT